MSDAERDRARESGSASTSSSRPGSTKVVRAIDAAADRDVPRDRTRPRRADAAARRARRARRRRSRSIATSPRICARRAPPNVDDRRGRLPRCRRADELIDGAAPTRSQPDRVRVAGNLPYNVASPILFKLVELYRAGAAARRRHGDAAARSRRPAARGAGHAATTAC